MKSNLIKLVIFQLLFLQLRWPVPVDIGMFLKPIAWRGGVSTAIPVQHKTKGRQYQLVISTNSCSYSTILCLTYSAL